MDNYLAIVFSSRQKSYNGLQALWQLDYEGKTTVHGASIVQRDNAGHINVVNRYHHISKATAIGLSLGALLGVLAGPIGVAAGMASATVLSTSALGTSVGLGALAGGTIGLTIDSASENERECASHQTLLELKDSEFAILAEVSEDHVEVINKAMKSLSGLVHRRSKLETMNSTFGSDYYGYYLHPYYYKPPYLYQSI